MTYKLPAILGLSAVLLTGFIQPALSYTDSLKTPEPAQNTLLHEANITKALEAGRLGNISFYDAQAMEAFYAARNYESAWLSGAFFQQRKAETLLKAFEEAWLHGLNPASYRIKEIKTLMQTGDDMQLDLILSDALVRYGRDLSGMRVNPGAIGQLAKYWRQPMHGTEVLEYVASASNTRAALENLAPQGKLYQQLQKELEALYTMPMNQDTTAIYVRGVVRPGETHKAVLPIRERLGLDAGSAIQGAYYYDDALAKAVMDFQRTHGLKPDGIIGPNTVKVMNLGRDDKIEQILVNMERLRWVEQDKPDRYVMVNVPSATLWAVEDGRVKLEMPVIVGRVNRPTNIFTTRITGIRFNPTWTVPPTIKRDDYLPKLREDPYYLSDRGIELMENNMTLDPGQVNWEEKTWAEVNAMRMVQGSGRTNPLGQVRVLMNNPYNIYLHDTPKKSYFSRANRALSSGCVRMKEAKAFADFVLSPNKGWTTARMEKILETGELYDLGAEQSLPVYILYHTVWLGSDGQVVYGPDLYGHDRKLLKELNNIGGVVYPVKENSTKTAFYENSSISPLDLPTRKD